MSCWFLYKYSFSVRFLSILYAVFITGKWMLFYFCFHDLLFCKLQMLNYNYLYSLNLWLLLNPWWLCFDWSMGCVPVISMVTDTRILAIGAFWVGMGILAYQCLQREPNRQTRSVENLTPALTFLTMFHSIYIVSGKVKFINISVGGGGLFEIIRRSWGCDSDTIGITNQSHIRALLLK